MFQKYKTTTFAILDGKVNFEKQIFVDEETASTLFPSINVYWRTVAAPDLKPKRRPHDSNS